MRKVLRKAWCRVIRRRMRVSRTWESEGAEQERLVRQGEAWDV